MNGNKTRQIRSGRTSTTHSDEEQQRSPVIRNMGHHLQRTSPGNCRPKLPVEVKEKEKELEVKEEGIQSL